MMLLVLIVFFMGLRNVQAAILVKVIFEMRAVSGQSSESPVMRVRARSMDILVSQAECVL